MSAATVTALPAPTWRIMRRNRYGSGIKPVAHAVRGGVTLCGLLPDSAVADDGSAARCPVCSAVPEGHATRHDMIALGITYRQLDFWTRQGFLVADNPDCGSGIVRTFPPETVEVARLMATYTAAGIGPSAAHHAALHDGWLSDTVRVVIDGRGVDL